MGIAPALRLRVTIVAVSLMTLSATVAALFVGAEDPADELAVLALPISVVSALVVTREATPLAARLLRRYRFVLGVVSVAFWAVILARLAGIHLSLGA